MLLTLFSKISYLMLDCFNGSPNLIQSNPFYHRKYKGAHKYGREYKLVMENHVSASFKTRNLYVCPKKYICRFMI